MSILKHDDPSIEFDTTAGFYICTNQVATPTFVAYQDENNNLGVRLQWFGETTRKPILDLTGKQFLFPMSLGVQDLYHQPEEFDLIYVGLVKNWPYAEGKASLAISFGDGAYITYFISSKFPQQKGHGEGPNSGAIPVEALLLSEHHVPIAPKEFHDDEVRIRAINNFNPDLLATET